MIYRANIASKAVSQSSRAVRGRGAAVAGSIRHAFPGRRDYAAFGGNSSQGHSMAVTSCIGCSVCNPLDIRLQTWLDRIWAAYTLKSPSWTVGTGL
jgi:hypothetical protein